jgi:hypothetical protein
MLRIASVLILTASLSACAESEQPPSVHGGETNWLTLCDGDADCDEGSCLCGVCTTACAAVSECAGSFTGSCIPAASQATSMLCQGAADIPIGLCLPSCTNDVACGQGFVCRDGACTIAPPTRSGPPGVTVEQDGVTFTARLQNDLVVVDVSDPDAIEIVSCAGTRLEKKNAQGLAVPLQDDRPGTMNPGHYLDDAYVAPFTSYGCDELGCFPPTSERIEIGVAREYVKTGTRAAPADAPNAGEIVDVIETRPLSGELIVHLIYSPAGRCDEHEATLAIDVPDEGVCCPIAGEGCAVEGKLGGWAPSLAECGPSMGPFLNEAWMQEDDLRGCPALVYKEDICCDCPSDETILHACAAAEPCEPGDASLVEAFSRSAQWTPISCILEALESRAPGRYEHETMSVFSNGTTGTRHTLVVQSDGSALYSRVPYAYGMGTPTSGEMPEPAKRCTLATPSYFADCLSRIATAPDDAATWPCAYKSETPVGPTELDWLTDCVEASPAVCE